MVAVIIGLAVAIVGASAKTHGSGRAAVVPTRLVDVDGAHAVPATLADPRRSFFLHQNRVTATPRPLVLVLHGWGQTAAEIRWIAQIDGYADAHNFLVAYPQGIDNSWNAGGCCGGANHDDLDFLTDVVSSIAKMAPVDRSRVYVWGFSNGGMMAWRAVCERPDVFAAAGVVSGALLVPCPAVVHVRHLHGDADNAVPWRGGKSVIPGLSVPDSSLEAWRVPKGSTVLTTVLRGWPHSWPTLGGPAHLNAAAVLWTYDAQFRVRSAGA